MKDIKGYEGLYAVTSCGKVWSYRANRFLKLDNSSPYARAELSKDGKAQKFSVHRLVAEAYIENPNSSPIINHKDCNKKNNCINNLEWCSYSYNNSYDDRAIKTAKLKAKRVIQMTMSKQIIKIWESAAEASRALSIGYVYRAANGSRKSAGGFTWRYVNEV